MPSSRREANPNSQLQSHKTAQHSPTILRPTIERVIYLPGEVVSGCAHREGQRGVGPSLTAKLHTFFSRSSGPCQAIRWNSERGGWAGAGWGSGWGAPPGDELRQAGLDMVRPGAVEHDEAQKVVPARWEEGRAVVEQAGARRRVTTRGGGGSSGRVHMNMRACARVNERVCTCIHTYLCTHMCTYLCTNTFRFLCIYLWAWWDSQLEPSPTGLCDAQGGRSCGRARRGTR